LVVLATATVAALLGVNPAGADLVDDGRVQVLSIGDSFIAGNGNGNYYPGQGPGEPDNGGPRVPGPGVNCFQSYSSYPWQYTQMLNDAGIPADIWHAACGGAWTYDLWGQFQTIPLEQRDQADILLVSAGGNDARFGNIVPHCVLGLPEWLPGVPAGTCDGDLAYATTELPLVIDRLESNLNAIAGLLPTDTQIVLMSYPWLNYPRCPTARGEDELDALQLQFDISLIQLVGRLNQTSGDRFRTVLPSSRFIGHGPCASSTDQWMHALTTTDGESFHPNWTGANQYAQQIFDQGIHLDVASHPPYVITPGGVGGAEGDTGSQVACVPVRLDRPAAEIVTVDWQTWDNGNVGIATANVDYATTSGTATFNVGESVTCANVTIFGDTDPEPVLLYGEWLPVVFSNPSANAVIDTTTFFGLGLVIIGEDD
jgi:lysophospholipase L1-like esterase